MADIVQFKGEVDWSGENPGISLKNDVDGPYVTLAEFFRVVVSPHGRGHMVLLMQSPHDASPPPERANLLLYDNRALANYLLSEFASQFGSLRGLPGLSNLVEKQIDGVKTIDDAPKAYREVITAADVTVELEWAGLGPPFCFATPPEMSATRKHHMISTFQGCADAKVLLNNKVLPGRLAPSTVAGHEMKTAMLAFSETWVRV